MRTDKIIGLVGTGIFLCLSLQGVSSLGSKILQEVLLFTHLNAILIYAISIYATLILELLLFVYVIKRIKMVDFNQAPLIRRVFLSSLIAYGLTQVLGFAQPLITDLYQNAEYLQLKGTYYDDLYQDHLLQNFAVNTPAWLLKYIIIIILILKELKSRKNEGH